MRKPMRKPRMEQDGELYRFDSYSDDPKSDTSSRKDSRREEARPWEREASYGQHIFSPAGQHRPWMAGQQKDSRPWPKQLVDSFRRDPNRHIIDPIIDQHDHGHGHHAAGGADPAWLAAQRTANTGLARKLKGRHLQMIAIGGSIGERRLFSDPAPILTS